MRTRSEVSSPSPVQARTAAPATNVVRAALDGRDLDEQVQMLTPRAPVQRIPGRGHAGTIRPPTPGQRDRRGPSEPRPRPQATTSDAGTPAHPIDLDALIAALPSVVSNSLMMPGIDLAKAEDLNELRHHAAAQAYLYLVHAARAITGAPPLVTSGFAATGTAAGLAAWQTYTKDRPDATLADARAVVAVQGMSQVISLVAARTTFSGLHQGPPAAQEQMRLGVIDAIPGGPAWSELVGEFGL